MRERERENSVSGQFIANIFVAQKKNHIVIIHKVKYDVSVADFFFSFFLASASGIFDTSKCTFELNSLHNHTKEQKKKENLITLYMNHNAHTQMVM